MSTIGKIVVRKAQKADMPAVLGLIRELAVFEKEPEAVEIGLEELEMGAFCPDPQFTCFVAQLDVEVVGMALVYFRFSTWKGRTLHLEDLVVREACRGKGVGTALFDRVLEYARECGVKRVNWVVLDWNKDAIAFYQKAGATVMPHWWQVEIDEKAYKTYLNQRV